MTPPRWFYPLVAVCLVVLTAAGAWRMVSGTRYTAVAENGVLDSRTGRVCYPGPGGGVCVELGAFQQRTVPTASSENPFDRLVDSLRRDSIQRARDPFADLNAPKR